jgi:membrane protein
MALDRLRQSVFVQRLRQRLESWCIGDPPVSVYRIGAVLIDKIVRYDLDQRAGAVAFNLTLAVFPAILFLFTLIPYIPINNLDEQILKFLSEIMPRGIFKEAEATINDIVSRRRGNVLSFGFLFALYTSTTGMVALMTAFNRSLRVPEQRSFLQARLVAVMLAFLLVLILVVALAVLIIGQIVLDELRYADLLSADFEFFSVQLLGYLTVFAVSFVAVSLIFYVAPAQIRRWRFVNIGSLTTSVLIILISNGFSYYLSNFASYNRLYGAVGTLIALMLWLYLISLVLILGFDLNVSLEEARAEAEAGRRADAPPKN